MNFFSTLFAKFKRAVTFSSANAEPFITDASVEYREIIEAVEREVTILLEPAPRQIGYDFQFSEAKKQILREKYGLNWKGPRYDGK